MLGLGGVSYIFQGGGGGGGNWKLHFSGPPLKTMVKGVGILYVCFSMLPGPGHSFDSNETQFSGHGDGSMSLLEGGHGRPDLCGD